MLAKLREFLTRLLPKRVMDALGKSLFLRNRVPPEAKIFASYLYISQGSSLRSLKRLLRDLGVRVSHVSTWKWIQRLGKKLKVRVPHRRERRALVVDETKIRIQKGWIWIFAAIDPDNREIVNLLVTRHREAIDALGFLRHCLRYCEGKPIIATDGGPWYRWPTQRLGLEHVVLCGGERNYIERWFETLKDRLRAFDCYFPTEGLETVENFTAVFRFWYNECRHHLSLKGPPSGGEEGFKAWLEVLS